MLTYIVLTALYKIIPLVGLELYTCLNDTSISSAMLLLFWGSNDARQKLRQKWKKHHQFILR